MKIKSIEDDTGNLGTHVLNTHLHVFTYIGHTSSTFSEEL